MPLLLHTSGNHNIVVADKLPKPIDSRLRIFYGCLINSLSSLSEQTAKSLLKQRDPRIRAEEVCLQTNLTGG